MDEQRIEQEGRIWFRSALGSKDLAILDRVCAVSGRPGKRLEKDQGLSSFLSGENTLHALAQKVLPGARPVRTVIFNKSEAENWYIPWHQDRVIAVDDKYEADGFSSWTNKEGTWHVEPPIDLLKNMIFARIHLDDADEMNGCLELALETHKNGRVLSEDVAGTVELARKELCRASRGDVLFVKALTLHRSERAKVNTNRRTLRVDYSADELPAPLKWLL